MTTRAHLDAIPDLAAEAFATRGTRPVSDDGDRRRAHPGSRSGCTLSESAADRWHGGLMCTTSNSAA